MTVFGGVTPAAISKKSSVPRPLFAIRHAVYVSLPCGSCGSKRWTRVMMRPIDDTIERVRAHYLEMPGQRLRVEQVHRLCGVEPRICQMVLDTLVHERFLCVKWDGHYVRV
jgi:hypothetical protein